MTVRGIDLIEGTKMDHSSPESKASTRAWIIQQVSSLLRGDPVPIDDMGYSEYDAAWVARVPNPEHPSQSAFPEVLEAIRNTQQEDGSWGPVTHYSSARIVCTLASMLALLEFGLEPRDKTRMGMAIASIRREWPLLDQDPELTAGFELIAPALLDDLAERGTSFSDLGDQIKRKRDRKISLLSDDILYSPHFSVGNALEFLGDKADLPRIKALQKEGGSINASVATTAYYARLTGDRSAIDYLSRCIETYGIARIPYGTPAYLWACIWILYNFRMGKILGDVEAEVRSHLDVIRNNVAAWGLSWSTVVEYGDADDTAVGLSLLAGSGYDVDWSLLDRYKKGGHFFTYAIETHPSVSVNAHVLIAAHEFSYPLGSSDIRSVVDFLISHQVDGQYWTDKWHASPYYPTSRAIRALAPYEPIVAERALKWILQNQREDGGWGFYEHTTAEESAYCIHALAVWDHQDGKQALARAGEFLLTQIASNGQFAGPPLWIAKSLYCPAQINRSSILAALSLCGLALDW